MSEKFNIEKRWIYYFSNFKKIARKHKNRIFKNIDIENHNFSKSRKIGISQQKN